MTKICTGCKKEKPLEDFSIHPKCKFGRNSKCKICKNDLAKHYFSKHKTRILKAQKKRCRKRFHRYGLSDEEYNRIHAEQSGKCAICGDDKKKLCVDHDHVSNVVRGLLCGQCNVAIGMLSENADTLRNAIVYIENGGRQWTRTTLLSERSV